MKLEIEIRDSCEYLINNLRRREFTTKEKVGGLHQSLIIHERDGSMPRSLNWDSEVGRFSRDIDRRRLPVTREQVHLRWGEFS